MPGKAKESRTKYFSLRYLNHEDGEYRGYFGGRSHTRNVHGSPRDCVFALLDHVWKCQDMMDPAEPGLERFLLQQTAFVLDAEGFVVRVISFRAAMEGE